MLLFRKMDKAHWTCFLRRLAPTFEASHEIMETAGAYLAGRDNSTSGDLSPARPAILCAPDYVISVCVALRSQSVSLPIGRPAFHPPSFPVLRTNIQRGRSSLHFQPRLVLWAGRSP